jgi:hypothetical protein
MEDKSKKNWYWTVIVSILCFYHFSIGHLGAEILTAKGWRKSVKILPARIFLLTPIFCDFLAWRAGTTRPGQCGRKSAHISRPAGCSQLLSDYMRRRQHLQRRGERGASYCGLCQAKAVRRFFTGLVYNFVWAYILLTPIFCGRQYFVDTNILRRKFFVDAYILFALIFCRCLYFVNAIFCRRQYFIDAYVLLTLIFLSMPIFCRRLYFVNANIFSTPIFGLGLLFFDANIFPAPRF